MIYITYHSIFILLHVMTCEIETFAIDNSLKEVSRLSRLFNNSELPIDSETDLIVQEEDIKHLPEQFIDSGFIKMGQIRINNYTLLNIILRINIILSKSHITYEFSQKEFKWDCYWFNKGKYCKFFIKIYKDNKKEESEYIIDITKTSNIHFIFTNFVKLFHIYFKNIYEIEQNECYSNYLLLDNNSNEMLSGVYILAIDQISQETDQTNIINSLEFLLEIFEYSNYHEYIINSGLQHNIIYLLFQLEYDKEENYHSIDMILYLLYLLSNTQIGKNAINKQQMLIDYLNKKIHQDLQYYEVYTLELSHLILANI